VFYQSSLEGRRAAVDKYSEAIAIIRKNIHPCRHFVTCGIDVCCYGECPEFEER
jgi:hypothetical protein